MRRRLVEIDEGIFRTLYVYADGSYAYHNLTPGGRTRSRYLFDAPNSECLYWDPRPRRSWLSAPNSIHRRRIDMSEHEFLRRQKYSAPGGRRERGRRERRNRRYAGPEIDGVDLIRMQDVQGMALRLAAFGPDGGDFGRRRAVDFVRNVKQGVELTVYQDRSYVYLHCDMNGDWVRCYLECAPEATRMYWDCRPGHSWRQNRTRGPKDFSDFDKKEIREAERWTRCEPPYGAVSQQDATSDHWYDYDADFEGDVARIQSLKLARQEASEAVKKELVDQGAQVVMDLVKKESRALLADSAPMTSLVRVKSELVSADDLPRAKGEIMISSAAPQETAAEASPAKFAPDSQATTARVSRRPRRCSTDSEPEIIRPPVTRTRSGRRVRPTKRFTL